MNKKTIIFSGLFLLIGLGLYLIFGNNSSNRKKTGNALLQGKQMSPTDDNLYPMGIPADIQESALSNFDGDDKKSYNELMDGLRTGDIVFTWEVWALRRKCPAEFNASQCNAALIAFIDKNYSSPEKEKLRELFESYFSYESEIHKMHIPESTAFAARYEMLKNKRREVLGKERSELFFGLEESQVGFIEAAQNHFKSTKDLPPDERVKKYLEMKKNNYGVYLTAVERREDPFDNYRYEIELREKEFAGLKADEKEKRLYALEVKFFGKEKADRMAKSRAEENEFSAKIENYKRIEEDFLKNIATLKPEEKEKKLQELRVKHLGAEEAENYKNRVKFEEETKNL